MKSRWLLIAYAICARNFLHFYRFLQHYLKTDDWMFVVSTRDLPLTSKRQSSFKVQSVPFFCSSLGDLWTLTATNFVNLHKIAFWISIKFKKELNGPLTTMHLLVFGLLTIPRGTWALHQQSPPVVELVSCHLDQSNQIQGDYVEARKSIRGRTLF